MNEQLELFPETQQHVAKPQPAGGMDVKLISFTGKGAPNEQWAAADLLLFTKSTRLEMRPNLLRAIEAMPIGQKLAELDYMARTIPSSWEFVDYIFLVTGVSRAYTHQQVRTRAASYAQQSMRIVNVSDFDYIFTERNQQSPTAMAALRRALEVIKATYSQLISEGQPTEDARGILPTNIATNIVCKFNMRTFVDLAKARTGGRTQSEYQRVVSKMVDEVLAVHPWMDKFLHGDLGRNYFDEIEAFAAEQFGGDLATKGKLLKIVDRMRKAAR
jgi:flavin-dependent thymidylate synthase